MSLLRPQLKGHKCFKVEGAGNDFFAFVILDFFDDVWLDSQVIQKLCLKRKDDDGDRCSESGADGLLVLSGSRKEGAEARMNYWNCDGMRAEMCGNGLRCCGLLLASVTGTRTGRIETDVGVRSFRLCGVEIESRSPLQEAQITLEMDFPKVGLTEPLLRLCDFQNIHERGKQSLGSICLDSENVPYCRVDMGNPHITLLLSQSKDELVTRADIERYGKMIEGMTELAGPHGTNVEFVAGVTPSLLFQRTWERGCGETLACGSGACAAAIAHWIRNGHSFTDPIDPLDIELLGGTLTISWDPLAGVLLTGPARICYESTTIFEECVY